MIRKIATAAVLLLAVLVGFLWAAGSGWLGTRWGAGKVTPIGIPENVVAERGALQARAAEELDPRASDKQILFGDLHVHTTFSLDAFMMALPATGGNGARPVADACDFARFCSGLDFWSINDHALALNPRSWSQTVDAIRQCNAVAGDPTNPDVVAFLGWEWTQFGTNPDNHYGHKNVILRDLDSGSIPTRPIAARAPADAWDRDPSTLSNRLVLGLLALFKPSTSSLDFLRYMRDLIEIPDCAEGVPVRELPVDCRESTLTPAGLFEKLDDWGFESIVIPHGTTWGFYTPHGSAWDKQLQNANHDPKRQTLIEVFSGHGNSEEFRFWKEIDIKPNGSGVCPKPTDNYLPSCWQAGEIIRQRCLVDGNDESDCDARAVEARQLYIDGDVFGHLTVPGVKAEEWLDSGQCRDCFQPSFNYRPKSSVQYIMALNDPDKPKEEGRFDFGFVAASDNHTARPGTGYKEYARIQMTDSRLPDAGSEMFGKRDPAPADARSKPFEPSDLAGKFFDVRESERGASFFLTGGLAAVHSEGRSREQIWDAMQRREVYGTSGPRILLWFDLLPDADGEAKVPMGGNATRSAPPRFRVRAVGSLEQDPGCPEYSGLSLTPEKFEHLCAGECYNPGDRRRNIARIEVTRIARQIDTREPVERLVDDAWQVYECPADPTGCTFEVEDPEFLKYKRDVVYYVRAIEEPSTAVNADLLRCEYDAEGRCIHTNPCPTNDAEDDYLAITEERAWSSPIFVEYAEPPPVIEEPVESLAGAAEDL